MTEPSIGHGLAIPAMQPLRPGTPPRHIVPGDTWEKVASQKMSGKRPTVTISAMDERGRVLYWHNHKLKRSSIEIFRRDWR